MARPGEERSKRRCHESRSIALALVCAVLIAVTFASFANGYSIGPNYRNISVDTHANITNAAPEVIGIFAPDPVTLVAGSTYTLIVNVTVRDYSGFNDIDSVNMTIWTPPSSYDANDNNETHYTNSSCTRGSSDGFYSNYSCSVDIYYYALNGTWNIIAYANDTKSFIGNNSNIMAVSPLYALNVTALIDYGDLAVYDTSPNRTANITNFGNVPINVTVYGYGNHSGDGLAMVCEFGNISIGMEKFSANVSADYADKINLSTTPTSIPGFVVDKQIAPETPIVNTTYWQLYVPPNPFGLCNGTVVFQAELWSG